jgi:hypothetical protein
MERKRVSSSNLKSVGYDISKKILEIEFLSGGVYQYFAVPSGIYTNLMNAASKGRFFHRNIKNVFAYQRII